MAKVKHFFFLMQIVPSLLIILPQPAYAQLAINLPPTPTTPITTSAGLPGQIVTVFFPVIITILGFIAVYYMVLASIRLIISKGEPEKVAEARSRLIYAVVGVIVLVLAYAFLRVINDIFLNSSAA